MQKNIIGALLNLEHFFFTIANLRYFKFSLKCDMFSAVKLCFFFTALNFMTIVNRFSKEEIETGTELR